MIKSIVGATALRVFKGEEDDDPDEIYISLGEYDEDAGTDSYGVPDDDIAHYAKDEDELKRLCSQSDDVNPEDWYLLEYSLVSER